MRPTWYDTLKYWNGKEILRECKDKNRLCVHANVWNTCADKPCEKGSKLLGKEADQFIVDEANAYTKGEKMTNREWLESLSDEELADVISDTCGGYCIRKHGCDINCREGVTTWLQAEHKEPKKELTAAQLYGVFKKGFQDRRAISLEEAEKIIKGVFEDE